MSLRVYNTLTREKEPFQTVTPNQVKMYLCGVTVYKTPHIGHMVGPVIFDAIKRYLMFKGYQVTLVNNITDVDDKIIDTAAKRNVSTTEIAERYAQEYLDALKWLGIDTIDYFPKASQYMAEIIHLTQTLIDRGHAYAADGNVWFDVATDKNYGKLSNRKADEQEAGTRELAGSGKKNPADFALWKAAKPGEPAWDSPWGKGRPGWHIECSAMSIKLLGQTFDIHGGGMDLMFPHHENELAQSECATGQPFARYWLHNGLTRIKTKASGGQWQMEKMAGSIGNVVNVLDMKGKGENPDLLRYLILSTHYRRPIEFNDEVLESNRKALSVFSRLLERVARLCGSAVTDEGATIESIQTGVHSDFAKTISAHRTRYLEVMDDDFNTAGAIGVLHEMVSEINGFIEKTGLEKTKSDEALKVVAAAATTFKKLTFLLGLFRQGIQSKTTQGGSDQLTEQLMQLLIRLREEARKGKNFALADGIRTGLTDIGVTLEDRPGGTTWSRK